MRGNEQKQASMLCLLSPADRVPPQHPLRELKVLVDEILKQLSPQFDALYSDIGRASIPPETLLKATLLMALFSVRSERAFCDQLDFNLLYRWFLDMDMLSASFDASTFSKNRTRLMDHDISGKFFGLVVASGRAAHLMSSEHFTVDGTLIEACASLKSFKRRDESDKDVPPDDKGNPMVDFHGEKRTNATHSSTTDPEARLMRKGFGKEARLSFSGHALMENKNGLLVDLQLAAASGYAERDTALAMLGKLPRGAGRLTVGGDAGYDTRDFIAALRTANITPHIAPNRSRRAATDMRTRRHAGYAISMRVRKRVEEIFGWLKTTGASRRSRYRGLARTQAWMYMAGAAYNLLRITKLMAHQCPA